jgi:hypothetical protein
MSARGVRAGGRLAAAVVLCGLALAACGSSKDKADPAPDGSPSVSASAPSPSATATPSTVVTTPETVPTTEAPLTNASFPKGSCVAEDPTDTSDTSNPTTVDCSSPLAVAKVLSREPFDLIKVTTCPKASATADKLWQVSRLGTGKDAGKLEYAALCLRNLGAPHPGDPGQGGGPNIVKGDCLVEHKNVLALSTGSDTSTVETACNSTGYNAPNYKVIGMGTQTIIKGDKGVPCPRGTQAEFAAPRELIGDVYCAVRV